MNEAAAETASTAIYRLHSEKENNPGSPPGIPTRLPLSEIHVEPAVFQVRSEGLVAERVEEIAKGLDGSNLDEPIHVWWSGLRWIVVEGHHRHAAYCRKERQTGITFEVPVVAHGDIQFFQAQGIAGQLNDRAKVRISKPEKLNNAWRMVCVGEGSIREQSECSGVSQSQISIMRKAKSTLVSSKMRPEHMIDAGWKQCREWSNGKPQRDHSPDALEAMAKELAEELQQIRVTSLVKSPDVFARAIELLSPALPGRLLEAEPFWDALDSTGRQLLQEIDQEDEPEPEVRVDF